MNTREFFDSQSDLTAVKILIYQEYLKSYLPKVLMQYGKCFIADFFCGPGKNGSQDGSPLMLLDAAQTLLMDSVLTKKWPKPEVVVVFTDSSRERVDNLVETLKEKRYVDGIKIVGPDCEEFSEVLSKTESIFKRIVHPKFFFLDPFTYSDVAIADLRKLIDTPAAEVLLFLPTFHSYRFVRCANEVGVLKNFLERFTDRGCADYADINDFNESIRRRLLAELDLKYVRLVGLNDGSRKNALFYLTKHVTGMMLMNRLVWKYAQDGVVVNAKRDNQAALFDLSTTTGNYARIREWFRDYLKSKKRLTNVQIIHAVAEHCFTNTHAAKFLKEMKDEGLISIQYSKSGKTRGTYVSDDHWDEELSVITYNG